jgi:FAD/FMN-containing dehydrogenase
VATGQVTAPALRPAPSERRRDHERAVEAARRSYAAIPPGARVRLAKRTSNLFRPRTPTGAPGLDLSGLTGVVEVDPEAQTARVGGLTTYEQLVDELLPHGFVPLVVPQLRTITIGGAVTGLGIEAASFRNGLPHESVREMRVLTGAGEVVTATPEGEHAELFRTFPNSYGSLGYVLDLVIELEQAHPWVLLRHVRFDGVEALVDAVGTVMADAVWSGERVDFVDGVVFGPREAYLTFGRWSDDVPHGARPSDYTGEQVYYRSIQHRRTDVLSAHDYLWRWDTDWFWCSRAFGAQVPTVRRLWPRHLLRSDVYWKIVALENRYRPMARLDRLRGLPPRERVVQDVEIPLARTAEFLDWFLREVPIEPVWLCPIRLRDSDVQASVRDADGDADADADAPGRSDAEPTPWPLYPMRRGEPYVNVGFWSTVPIEPGASDGDVNRRIEDEVTRLGGHKSLYSDAYYDEATFARLYGGPAYTEAKNRYDPAGRLPTLYEKAVRAG